MTWRATRSFLLGRPPLQMNRASLRPNVFLCRIDKKEVNQKFSARENKVKTNVGKEEIGWAAGHAAR
jgi:hypothetical protein